MTTYDQALSVQKIAEAREYISAVVEPHPPHLDTARKRAVVIDRLGAISGMIDRHGTLADQLEAAGREVERLTAVALDIEQQRRVTAQLSIARELETDIRIVRLKAECDILHAERQWLMERLGTRIRHLEHVGPCTLCGDRAQDLRDLLEEEGRTAS